MNKYTEKNFSLGNIEGLSQKQIKEHLKLYSGYVKNTNLLNEKLSELEKDSEQNKLAVSELRRRYSFEWNGMRLHEYYFDALGGDGKPDGKVLEKLESDFGSYEKWLSQFKNTGTMRGVGWTLLVYDNIHDICSNIWVSDHEVGHLAGVKILIAMDVWEHAYLLDYLPSERNLYIEVFLKNLNWKDIDNRFSS